MADIWQWKGSSTTGAGLVNITGSVTVNVSGTVTTNISSGSLTVAFSGSQTVSISGNVTIDASRPITQSVIYTGSVTWSAGSTTTAANTLSISLTSSSTTKLHEFAFSTVGGSDVTADIRPVSVIASSSITGDASITVAIPKPATVRGLSVSGKNIITRGLFNNGTVSLGFTLDASASATVTINLEVREIQGEM